MTVTPINAATHALREASGEALLDAIVQLTHRIHSYGMREGGTPRDRNRADTKIIEAREQRAMVRAEVLRRIEAGIS